MSATLRVIAPRWMKLANPSGTRSCGMRPSVGFSPSTPVQAAGRRVEAPASVVSAIRTSPAATDTPPPQLDPPHVTFAFQGLTVRPVNGEEPIMVWANSVVVLLPMMTAPAARSRATAIVSAVAGAASCIRPRSPIGRQSRDVENVLHADRNAGERSRGSIRLIVRVELARRCECAFAGDADESVEVRLAALATVQRIGDRCLDSRLLSPDHPSACAPMSIVFRQ